MVNGGGMLLKTACMTPSEEELARLVELKTFRRVSDLVVDCSGVRVKLTGTSQTFYVKQLATQAVRNLLPHVELENEIEVCSN